MHSWCQPCAAKTWQVHMSSSYTMTLEMLCTVWCYLFQKRLCPWDLQQTNIAIMYMPQILKYLGLMYFKQYGSPTPAGLPNGFACPSACPETHQRLDHGLRRTFSTWRLYKTWSISKAFRHTARSVRSSVRSGEVGGRTSTTTSGAHIAMNIWIRLPLLMISVIHIQDRALSRTQPVSGKGRVGVRKHWDASGTVTQVNIVRWVHNGVKLHSYHAVPLPIDIVQPRRVSQFHRAMHWKMYSTI